MNQNKVKILSAASHLFLQGGTAALSVRAIAKAAGVSTIGIYSHFEGKQGILDALYIQGFEYVIESLKLPEQALAAREAVLQVAQNYLNFAQSHKAHYRLIFGESDPGYTPSLAAKTVGAQAFSALTQVVGKLFDECASQEEKQIGAMQVWALIHGSISLNNHVVAELVNLNDWKAHVMQALAIMIDGLAPHQATSV